MKKFPNELGSEKIWLWLIQSEPKKAVLENSYASNFLKMN